MSETIAPNAEQVTLARLDDQLHWYSRKSQRSQAKFKFLKFLTIVFATVIPIVATSGTIPYHADIAAGLGLLIAVMEGLQQLNHYQTDWISYRAAAEALKREKFLFLGRAGAYGDDNQRQALLAERVESIISQENSSWVSTSLPKNGEKGGQSWSARA